MRGISGGVFDAVVADMESLLRRSEKQRDATILVFVKRRFPGARMASFTAIGAALQVILTTSGL
jgi:hypothetical protein